MDTAKGSEGRGRTGSPNIRRIRYCVVRYRPNSWLHPSADEGIQILFMALCGEAELSILVNPKWREFVEPRDVPYISGLLSDLRSRAILAPEDTFNHLLTLEAGRLVFAEAGEDLGESPDLLELASGFKLSP
jgi:hypothetical protein